jgi:nickel/cobalt exporter
MTRRLVAAALLGLTGLLLLPTPAQAHPLGDFTTNQYSGLRVTAGGIDVDYVLDLAELPAYQARQEIGDDHDGYADRTCAAAAEAATLTAGDRVAPLTARTAEVAFPPGTGGLDTLRLQCVLHADVRITGEQTVTYRQDLYADRIGWREITAVGDRVTLVRSSVPVDSVSGRLTAYPGDVTTLDARGASLTVRPGGPAAGPAPFAATPGSQARDVDRLTAWFTELVGNPQLTWGVGLLAFLVAVVLGGAHAVAPGHGKTIMAAYLIGSRGRIAQALIVAGTVAATHTVGVLALGVLLATSLTLAPDALYEWLRLASGVLVAGVGAHLLWRAVQVARRRRSEPPPADHSHDHDHDHGHSHDHDHDHGPAATRGITDYALVPVGGGHAHGPRTHSHGGGRPHTHHLPDPDEPLNVRTLLAMGFAGGLSPSPSAVIVLLGAAALGRAWYGVVLVLAYGIGLAATLTGIGFALARWGDRLRNAGSDRWSRLLTRRMPIATATVILTVGTGMVGYAAISLTSR